MTHEELEICGLRLFGEKWQPSLARLLRLNASTVWRWASGKSPIPDHTAMLIGLLVDDAELVKKLDSYEWTIMVDLSRTRASMAVKIAIRTRVIQPSACEVCGKTGEETQCNGQRRTVIQAHHDDYNFPLHIRWLCRKHHRMWHVENQAPNMSSDMMTKTPTELYEIGCEQMGIDAPLTRRLNVIRKRKREQSKPTKPRRAE